MTRTTGPLLTVVAASFMALPTPAHAHGLPPAAATFLLALLVLAPVAQTLADYFVIEREAAGNHAGRVALLANLVAFAVALPLFVALQWLSGTAAIAAERTWVSAAYGLRMLSPWLEVALTIAAIAMTKATVLGWRFTAPVSRRMRGFLFLSTLAATCLAATVAALVANVANR